MPTAPPDLGFWERDQVEQVREYGSFEYREIGPAYEPHYRNPALLQGDLFISHQIFNSIAGPNAPTKAMVESPQAARILRFMSDLTKVARKEFIDLVHPWKPDAVPASMAMYKKMKLYMLRRPKLSPVTFYAVRNFLLKHHN